ncbi:MAG: hypothetical protein JNM86_01345 [Phycisphaerae bacterium]|nr:hypothetical protein [Phycisphaerae bacterium]MBN8597361.1 hypothetical protein [Planctomycetota bacterium]
MSAVRRFSFSRQALSGAAEAFRHRTESVENSKREAAPGFAQTFSDLAGRAFRIASIDLDRDPWWLYFRRRR